MEADASLDDVAQGVLRVDCLVNQLPQRLDVRCLRHVVLAAEGVIGAGALITKPTEPKGVYLGATATMIPKKSDELRGI